MLLAQLLPTSRSSVTLRHHTSAPGARKTTVEGVCISLSKQYLEEIFHLTNTPFALRDECVVNLYYLQVPCFGVFNVLKFTKFQ